MNTMLLHTVLVLMMQLSDAVIHSYAHRALIGYNLTVVRRPFVSQFHTSLSLLTCIT